MTSFAILRLTNNSFVCYLASKLSTSMQFLWLFFLLNFLPPLYVISSSVLRSDTHCTTARQTSFAIEFSHSFFQSFSCQKVRKQRRSWKQLTEGNGLETITQVHGKSQRSVSQNKAIRKKSHVKVVFVVARSEFLKNDDMIPDWWLFGIPLYYLHIQYGISFLKMKRHVLCGFFTKNQA